jgi:hypothetical protein
MATIFGDPLLNPTLSGKLHAKNQTLVGIDNQDNIIVGDVDTITDHAKGGNDDLTGGNNTGTGFIFNGLNGDANTMSGFAQGATIL